VKILFKGLGNLLNFQPHKPRGFPATVNSIPVGTRQDWLSFPRYFRKWPYALLGLPTDSGEFLPSPLRPAVRYVFRPRCRRRQRHLHSSTNWFQVTFESRHKSRIFTLSSAGSLFRLQSDSGTTFYHNPIPRLRTWSTSSVQPAITFSIPQHSSPPPQHLNSNIFVDKHQNETNIIENEKENKHV